MIATKMRRCSQIHNADFTAFWAATSSAWKESSQAGTGTTSRLGEDGLVDCERCQESIVTGMYFEEGIDCLRRPDDDPSPASLGVFVA